MELWDLLRLSYFGQAVTIKAIKYDSHLFVHVRDVKAPKREKTVTRSHVHAADGFS